MSFTSLSFWVFFALTLVTYYAVTPRARWRVLLVASLGFCLISSYLAVALVMTVTVTVYVAARILYGMSQGAVRVGGAERVGESGKGKRAVRRRRRLCVLWCALIINFGALIFLRLSGAIPSAHGGISAGATAMPMGLPFYSFSGASYLADVYTGKLKPEKDPFKLALFISFFPALAEGPILRYPDTAATLFAPHRARWENISTGILRMSYGYFKKLVIADTLAPVTRKIAVGTDEYTGAYVLFLIVAYSVQIYADFTGGIDVALGVARSFGIKLCENFDRPFASTSLKEYWKHWHISLGAWFEEYVFYPLSLTRPMQKLSKFCRAHIGKGAGVRVPVYISTLVTWLLTGLWHGARWHFAVWGLANGALMLISRELEPLCAKVRKRTSATPLKKTVYVAFCRARTFMVVGAIRLLDLYRSTRLTAYMLATLPFALDGWRTFFDSGAVGAGLGAPQFCLLIFSVAAVWSVSAVGQRRKTRGQTPLADYISSRPALLCSCIVALAVITLVFGAYGIGYEQSEFIYSQF